MVATATYIVALIVAATLTATSTVFAVLAGLVMLGLLVYSSAASRPKTSQTSSRA